MQRCTLTRTLAVVLAVVALGATGCLGAKDATDPGRGAGAKDVTLTIGLNAIAGGKNAVEAEWVTKYVIPMFTDRMKQQGINATVKFQPSGVDDEQYKTKLALDLKTGGGPDIVSLDGIWVGEFAEAGYLKPLDEIAGDAVGQWPGLRRPGGLPTSTGPAPTRRPGRPPPGWPASRPGWTVATPPVRCWTGCWPGGWRCPPATPSRCCSGSATSWSRWAPTACSCPGRTAGAARSAATA